MNRVLLAAAGVVVTVAAFGENAVGCELGGTRQAPRAGNVAAAQESAAHALESLITARGPEAAAAEYRKTVAGNARCVVVESEVAALGDRYRQSGRVREEIAVFEIATEALPTHGAPGTAWARRTCCSAGTPNPRGLSANSATRGKRVMRSRLRSTLGTTKSGITSTGCARGSSTRPNLP